MPNGKILAIDDERNIRRLIRNEFSFEGFEVATAGSGEEGLRVFEGDRFDAVLLDIKLPKMGGIQTLRSIKAAAPDAEVIMITGYGDVQSAVEAMKLGARDYITKLTFHTLNRSFKKFFHSILISIFLSGAWIYENQRIYSQSFQIFKLFRI